MGSLLLPPIEDHLPRRPPTGIDENHLLLAFQKLDVENNGELETVQIRKLLSLLRVPDNLINVLLSEWEKPAMRYDELRLIIKRYDSGAYLDDVAVIGAITCALADAGVIRNDPTEKEIQDVFHGFSSNGTLDKVAIPEALRYLGKSERQIQVLIDSLRSGRKQSLNIQEFTELCSPQRLLTYLPGIGHAILFLTQLANEQIEATARSMHRHSVLEEEQYLAQSFQKGLERKDGTNNTKLNKGEVIDLLRRKAFTEAEIKNAIEDMPEDGMSLWDFRKVIKGPKYKESTFIDSLYEVPVVGPTLVRQVRGGDSVPAKDVRQVFEHVRRGDQETISKARVAVALRELGKPKKQIAEYMQSVDSDEVTLDGLKQLLKEGPRHYNLIGREVSQEAPWTLKLKAVEKKEAAQAVAAARQWSINLRPVEKKEREESVTQEAVQTPWSSIKLRGVQENKIVPPVDATTDEHTWHYSSLKPVDDKRAANEAGEETAQAHWWPVTLKPVRGNEGAQSKLDYKNDSQMTERVSGKASAANADAMVDSVTSKVISATAKTRTITYWPWATAPTGSWQAMQPAIKT